jgi:hypothetical protein
LVGITNEQMADRRRQAFKRRGQSITYKRYLSSEKDFKTGAVTVEYESKSIPNVLVWDLDTITIIQSNSKYHVGDSAVRLLREQFPYENVSTRDVIVIGGESYTIVREISTGDTQAITVVIRK